MLHRSPITSARALAIVTTLFLLSLPLLERPANASSLSRSSFQGFTGNVEHDFPIDGIGIVTIVDNPGPDGQARSNDVAQSLPSGRITGFNIKDMRLAYDNNTDTMFVGLNFFGIAGDADGSGIPGNTTLVNGRDEPSLGGLESITVMIDTTLNGKTDILAGVPAVKPSEGKGTDHFTVARYRDLGHGPSFSYGETLTNHLGELAFDPSPEHPHFQFSIANFKQLPGLDPAEGFAIGAYAGSPVTGFAGEDYLVRTVVTFPPLEQQIPEPSTILAWALMASGAAAYGVRRRRQTSAA